MISFIMCRMSSWVALTLAGSKSLPALSNLIKYLGAQSAGMWTRGFHALFEQM